MGFVLMHCWRVFLFLTICMNQVILYPNGKIAALTTIAMALSLLVNIPRRTEKKDAAP